MDAKEQPLTAEGVPVAPDTATMLQDAITQRAELDVSAIGSTGLKHQGGLIREELLPQLDGEHGLRIYREMAESDPVIFGILQAIDKIIRQCKWTVDPASNADFDQEAAEFLDTCIEDMEVPFTEFVSEALTMLPYGFSAHELVYKQRAGQSDDPRLNSQYDDGRVGWRGMPIRSQDTIQRWDLDDAGTINGFEQLAPPNFALVKVPARKMVLFRTSVHKNNPQGKSVLRGAYRPWYFKTRIEVSEAIGAERDLAGLPIAYVPSDILNPNQQDPKKKAVHTAVKNILTGVRNDSQAAIMFPSDRDQSGNKLFEFALVSSGGSRQFDTDKIIQRYDNRIAITMLADFILMGQSSSSTGSFAMHTDKTKMFLVALTAYLSIIADTLNKVAIPRLFAYNSFPVSRFPKLVPGSIEGADLGTLGPYLQVLSQIGMPLFPNPALEAYLLKAGGMPANSNEAPVDPGQQVQQADGVEGPVPQSPEDAAAIEALVQDSLQTVEPGAEQVLKYSGVTEVQKKKYQVLKAGWSEGDHPRGTDGKFGEGGGAGPGPRTAKEAIKAHPDLSAAQHLALAKEHRQAGRLEQAFAHIDASVSLGKKKPPQGKAKASPSNSKTLAIVAAEAPTVSAAKQVKSSEPLNSREKATLKGYQGRGYKDLNNGLRGKNGPQDAAAVEHRAKALDAAIEKSELRADSVSYRGVHLTMFQGGKVKPGDILSDKGFTSTTGKLSVAKEFSGAKGSVLVITHRAGQKALSVNNHLGGTKYSREQEVIVPRNARMRVTGTGVINGTHHVFLERLE